MPQNGHAAVPLGQTATAPRRLVVFPNDPIYKYYEKGEIKERYWNPQNIFDEVHLISLADNEVEAEKVSALAGRGKLFIHPVGRPKPGDLLRLSGFRDRVVEQVGRLAPDLIRAHNPSIHGWLAAQCGQHLGVPSVISIHCDYSRWRNFRILGGEYTPRFLRSLLERVLFEGYAFKQADRILPAYRFPLKYIHNFRTHDIEVIYNKVYSERYPQREYNNATGDLRILSVGRHIPGKDPRHLIRAIEGLAVELTLVGTGPLTAKVRQLTKDLGLEEQVRFVDSVPNNTIHHEYMAADIYAMAIEYGGISIPVIEAMAAGLPIVVAQPMWEDEPEVVGGDSLAVENSAAGFRDAFKKLLADPQLREQLGRGGRSRMEAIDGSRMEEREAELFLELIQETAPNQVLAVL